MPPPKRKGVKQSSDTSGNEVEAAPFNKPFIEDSEMEVSTYSEVKALVESRKARKRAKQVSASASIENRSASDAIGAVKAITARVTEVLFDEDSPVLATAAKKLVGLCGEFEQVAMLLDSMTVRPKLQGGVSAVQPTAGGVAVGQIVGTQKPVRKVVETYSAIVRSMDPSASPEALMSAVVKEVGPTLGVRVHEVKPVRSGGVLIRTPSKTQKVVENAKFKELGLEVQVNQKLGPRVVIQGVHSEIYMEGVVYLCVVQVTFTL